ncbi:hypothetical protein AB1L42_07850 [Thalassoglobus sp. JC818]|uniref:hypothetical protein n=1 Tax=Thalassoglobus sp. JC818 TaxID=3232136 RepID=UPI0034592A2C
MSAFIRGRNRQLCFVIGNSDHIGEECCEPVDGAHEEDFLSSLRDAFWRRAWASISFPFRMTSDQIMEIQR